MMEQTSTGNAAATASAAVVWLVAGRNHHRGSGRSRGQSGGRPASIGFGASAAAVTLALALALTLRPVDCSIGSTSERTGDSTTMTSSSYSTDQATTSETDTAASALSSSNLSSGAGGQPQLASDGESVKFPLYMRLIATFVCLIIFTVGVCGNLLVPLVVIKTKYLRNSTNLFLINLSIADLLVLIFCMPTMLIELHSRPETWLLGETMCKLGNFIEMLAANSSIFTILAISFERYYAICKPLKAGYKCTRLRASIIIGIIWLLSCILTSPILNMAKSDETIYIDGSVVRNCILETATYWNRMYVFVSMIAFFCLPLLVLMLVYWLIGRRLIRENVSMMDATRDNLIDNKSHKRQPNDIYDTSTSGGSYVSSVFKKRFNARAHRSIRTLFKLGYQHGGGHALAHNMKLVHGQSQSIDYEPDTKRGKSICMPQERSAKRVATNHSSSFNGVKRGNLRGAQTLSLDNHGNHQRKFVCQSNRSPSQTIQSQARGQPDGQSLWSSIVTQTDHEVRAQSSSLETTTTTAATASSLTPVDMTGEIEAGHIRVSFLDRLRLDFKFLGNLLSGANPSSKPNTVSKKVDDTTVHTNSLLGSSLKFSPKDERENRTHAATNGHSHDLRLSYETGKQIDHSPGLVNGSNHISSKESDEKLKSCERIRQFHGNNLIPVDEHEHVNRSNMRAMTTDVAQKSTKRESSDGPRRLSSSLKRYNEERGSPPMRSRFKWVKGVSVSSSTGSTRTNSTCLTSDTGSVRYRHQNSPSPPRLMHQHHQQQQQKTESKSNIRDHKCEQNISSHNRDTSSEGLIPVIEHREIDPEEACVQTRGRIRPTDMSVIRSTRRTLLGSRSSSITYNEAEISSYSEESSSPSCSIAADFTSTRSWIESLSLQDQKIMNDSNQLQGQQLRLSQTDEGPQFMDDLIRATTKLESVNELPSINMDTGNRAQILEVVVDEDEDNMNDSNCMKTNSQLDNNWRTRSKLGATISFSDTAPGTNIDYDDDEKVLGINSLDKRYNHDLVEHFPDHKGNSNCDLIVSENSGQFREANPGAIVECRNGIESLQQNVTSKRSGSHPVVSCHRLAKLADGPVEIHCLQHEFIAVRDVSKKQQMDSRRQVVAMLAFVVACFFLLFFPYRVFTIWLIMSTEDQVQSLGMETYYNITYFSRILIYLHSAINPIAYNLISTKFRRAFTSILLCRGASTRRNFNVDHRYVYKPKNQTNYQARPRITDCSSNKSPTALRAPA